VRAVGTHQGAVSPEDQQEDVEVGLGVGADAAAGRDADDIGVELPSGLRQPPQRAGRRVTERHERRGVAQHPREGAVVDGTEEVVVLRRHQVLSLPLSTVRP
jgi:hypothetical protein